MTENNDIIWYAMSDKAILQLTGGFIKEIRLSQNKTQLQLATSAGISRSTLVLLENGHGGTLGSFIQVMRTLHQLHIFGQFQIRSELSPLQLAKLEQKRRKRSRNKNASNEQNKSDW